MFAHRKEDNIENHYSITHTNLGENCRGKGRITVLVAMLAATRRITANEIKT
jgi:hypothetical protein